MRIFCLNRKGKKSALLLGVSLFLSLVACGEDSSSTSAEDNLPVISSAAEQPVSSDSKDEATMSSSAIEQVASCTEEQEGQIYTIDPLNPKYDSVTYEKCKNGTWVSIPEASAKCEMENIQIGDTCSYEVSGSYMSSTHGIIYCSVQVYQGDDLWKSVNYGLCDTLTVGK